MHVMKYFNEILALVSVVIINVDLYMLLQQTYKKIYLLYSLFFRI